MGAQGSSIMAGWVHSAVLKESNTPASLRLCITLFPCSLRYHGSGLRWASKNLSLSKMDTPASLICKLCKLAKLQNQTDFMPAGDVVQQVWSSQWAQPAHMWEAKAVTIDFFTGRLKDSCWHNGACLVLQVLCVCFKTKSPRGMQPFLEVYCEFPSQFPSPLPYFEATLPLRAEGAQCLLRGGYAFQGHPRFPAVPWSQVLPGSRWPWLAAETAVQRT